MFTGRVKILEWFIESNGVSTDTRTLAPGQIFFALRGDNFDGNAYATAALKAGAMRVVVDRPEKVRSDKYLLVDDALKSLQQLAADYRASLSAKVIAITGTNGKTTTKELLTVVLKSKYKVHATSGNFNNHIGVPLTILSAPRDTEVLLLEMGANHPGEIEALCEIADPDYGYITNIGSAHLEGFGTKEMILETKGALLKWVCEKQDGIAFVNAEDPMLELFSAELSCARLLHPYMASSAGSIKVVDERGTPYLNLRLKKGLQNVECPTQLIGNYNTSNIIAALEIADFFGIPLEQGVRMISLYRPENSRSEYRDLGRYRIVLDAYNANLSSMIAAINNFCQIDAGRKVCILGDMLELGDSEQDMHQQIVDLLQEKGLEAVLFGEHFDNTRHDNIPAFRTIEEIVHYVNQVEGEELWLLVKGSRGMRLERILEKLQ